MYDIERGDIKYGNQSIFDIPLSKWRTKIGYVMQSNSMMSGTIRDNILYGINRKVDDEELIEYAKLIVMILLCSLTKVTTRWLVSVDSNYQVVNDKG